MPRPAGPVRSASPTLKYLFGEATKRGIKNAAIANHLRVTETTVHRWRSGVTTPSILEVEDFAEFLKEPIHCGTTQMIGPQGSQMEMKF